MVATPGLPPALLAQVPVSQPAHLEGDNSLATEILPGPPSVQSARLAALKRDPHSKKAQYLYLPAADPGTSYAGIAGFGFANEVDEPVETNGKRSKTAVGSTTRAQRASARHLTAAPRLLDETPPEEPMTQPIAPAELEAIVADASQPSRSHSVEAPAVDASASASARPKRPNKGKGKDREMSAAVKVESKTVSPEPSAHAHRNEDYCSSCHSGQTSGGASFVYCDGCPRAFHLSCLDPPKSSIDEERWFCVSCTAKMNPARKTPPSMLSSIIDLVDSSNATEFQLPESIRTFFKDVTTGPRGMYMETTSVKPHRPNRQGQAEERDPYRLRDRNGETILCYACRESALPEGTVNRPDALDELGRSAATLSSPSHWKSIVSCDFCTSHWHLDCLDPPETMPPLSKKWKCPIHADRIVRRKNRIPKGLEDIKVDRPGQYNNGHIEIDPYVPQQVNNEAHKPDPKAGGKNTEEITINGRRYRVPEKYIVLDFWNKVAHKPPSALDEEIQESRAVSSPPPPPRRSEDVQMAQLLCNMPHLSLAPPVQPPGHPGYAVFPTYTPSIPLPSPSSTLAPWPSFPPMAMPALPTVPRPTPAKAANAQIRSAKSQGKQRQPQPPPPPPPQAKQDIVFQPQPLPAHVPTANGTLPRIIGYSNDVRESQTATGHRKRKKPTPISVPPSTRELRKKSAPLKEKEADSSLSSLSSLEDVRDAYHKPDVSASISAARPVSGKTPVGSSADATPAPGGPGPSQVNGHAATLNGAIGPPSVPAPSLSAAANVPTAEAAQDDKRTRGARKRKERSEEEGALNGWRPKASPGVQKAKEARPASMKERRTPRPSSGAASAGPGTTSPSAPTTPSLKIRLPRLASLNASAAPSAAPPPVSQPAMETPSH
ncbi:hypothetical protein HDZ31DRAFT_36398 [Schizophyllum fasciatum]